MNSVIITCLERSVEPKRISSDEVLRQARMMRKNLIYLPEAIQIIEKTENQMKDREFLVNKFRCTVLLKKIIVLLMILNSSVLQNIWIPN
jgi:hypothetical protein